MASSIHPPPLAAPRPRSPAPAPAEPGHDEKGSGTPSGQSPGYDGSDGSHPVAQGLDRQKYPISSDGSRRPSPPSEPPATPKSPGIGLGAAVRDRGSARQPFQPLPIAPGTPGGRGGAGGRHRAPGPALYGMLRKTRRLRRRPRPHRHRPPDAVTLAGGDSRGGGAGCDGDGDGDGGYFSDDTSMDGPAGLAQFRGADADDGAPRGGLPPPRRRPAPSSAAATASASRSPLLSRSFQFGPSNAAAEEGRSPFVTPHHGQAALGPSHSFSFGRGMDREPQSAAPITDGNHGGGDHMEGVVRDAERLLRQAALCGAAFLAGTAASPECAAAARRVLELALAAWGTCVFLLGWSWRQRQENTGRERPPRPPSDAAAQSLMVTPMSSNLSAVKPTARGGAAGARQRQRQESFRASARSSFNAARSGDDDAAAGKKRVRSPPLGVPAPAGGGGDGDGDGGAPAPPSAKARRQTAALEPAAASAGRRPPRQHPQLENLYVMAAGEGARIFPNEAYDIDNHLFHGKMLLRFRTSDVDDASPSPAFDGDAQHNRAVEYFRGKSRRFEFQWQFRLKALPPGGVLMSLELSEPIHMGMIQRALSNTALKFVKKLNPGFTYFVSSAAETGPSLMSFPLGTSMDRFCVTHQGSPLPVLGEEIVEDPEALKQRKKGAKIQWSTDVTYTMALWSAYFDWIDWQVLNFPGIRPFSATSIAGMQPITMTLCTTAEGGEATETTAAAAKDAGEHPKREKVFAMEVSNATKSTLGSEAKRWIADTAAKEKKILFQQQQRQQQLLEDIDRPLKPNKAYDYSDENESFGVGEEEDVDVTEDEEPFSDMEDQEEGDPEGTKGTDDVEDEMTQLDNSSYLRSGCSICLREGTDNYVASGGGFGVLQSSPTSSIELEKIQPKKKKGRSFSVLIHSGDVVRVKLVDGKSVKYLSLHRGWWLRWNSSRPNRDGLFCVRTHGPDGSLVVFGDPFSLVSQRWSHYRIGVCIESSAKYGGRMLGIYKEAKNNHSRVVEEEVLREEDDAPMQRMAPLLLYAQAYEESKSASLTKALAFSGYKPTRQVSEEDAAPTPMLGATSYEITVPAWLEVMDRKKRTKHLVYAVRVKETMVTKRIINESTEAMENTANIKSSGSSYNEDNIKQSSCVSTSRIFVKFRTGRDLAPILRLGAEYKSELVQSSDHLQQSFDFPNQDELNDAFSSSSCSDSTSSSSDDFDSEEDLEDEDEPSHFLIAGPNHSALSGEATTSIPDDHKEQDAVIQMTPSADLAIDEENCAIDESDMPNRRRKSGSPAKHLPAKNMRCDDKEDTSRREGSMSTISSKIEASSTVQRPSSPIEMSLHINAQSDVLDPTASNNNEAKKKSRTKHAAMIGRVAKTVKASTVITGKHVIKSSKYLGKGTVSAGIAAGKGTVSAGRAAGKGTVSAGRAAGRVIPVSAVVYNKPPRKHEPGGRVNRRRASRNNKEISRVIKNIEGKGNVSASFVAGQLSNLDQRCRKISRILSDISTTSNSAPVLSAISSFAKTNLAQDQSTLRGSLRMGSSAELGVKLKSDNDCVADIDCVVARCIYSGRWCEELCVLYSKPHGHLAFYAPLAKKPSLVVSFEEIMSARKCDDGTSPSDLPGFHLMSLDTQWKCHYVAFLEKAERDDFLKKLMDALIYTNGHLSRPSKIAQEYESYMMSLEASLTGTVGKVGKWHPVSTGKNKKQVKLRRILNARRMAFDVLPIITTEEEIATNSDAQANIATYVENLLKMALSFSTATEDGFNEFLDEACRLRTLPLHQIDLASKEAFCIFVNMYHCLLQHSLLLAVDGLPTKRSVIHFKRCSCYEIGEDVFSLAELECCVIRDKASRSSNIKSPFVSVAKKSRIYQRIYGLDSSDERINFLLNNGDMAYPSTVPVLQPQTMDDAIDTAASCFLTDQVKIDERKKTVFLPKVCHVYRMGDGLVSLSQCLIHLDESKQLAIGRLLDNGVVSVKFQRNCEEFHPNLTELR